MDCKPVARSQDAHGDKHGGRAAERHWIARLQMKQQRLHETRRQRLPARPEASPAAINKPRPRRSLGVGGRSFAWPIRF